ncbi:unnamed protein product [Gordionus sp. m RMFG-2023]
MSPKGCIVKTFVKDANQLHYEYLADSVIPTNHFQASLPRLPIPKLEDTCFRYLNSQKALLPNIKEYNFTEKCVTDFLNNDGPKLQQQLIEKDQRNKQNSYISDLWFSYYLQDRRPLALNTNPFISIKDDPKPRYNSQLLRATNLIISSIRFMKSYKSNTLEPDIYHLKPQISNTQLCRFLCKLTPKQLSFYTSYMFSAFPLDMSQYKDLFCSSRIPHLGTDSNFTQPNDKPNLIVSCSGRMYSITLFDKNGAILPANVIYSILSRIKTLNQGTPNPPRNNVGLMTAICDRNEWAVFRDDMIRAFSQNFDLLRTVDSGFYVLCLDGDCSAKTTIDIIDERSQLARNFLLAPLDATYINRWFDKSFQLIVGPGGQAAVNMEHSWGDGVSVVRFLTDIYIDSVTRPALDPKDANTTGLKYEDFITSIDFKLNSDLEKKLTKASNKLVALNQNFDIQGLQYDKFGKNFIKSCGLSPDSILQLSFQMANYKILTRTSASYESCSTAAFKKGRTETIRPATLDTKSFCKTFLDKTFNLLPDAAKDMVRSCSKTHSKLTREAAMGQGFDRHLFILKHLSEGTGKNLPSIFTDPAYALMNKNILSTSTVESPIIEMGGFGPVVPEGLGISYGIEKDKLGVFATSYRDSGSKMNSKIFIQKVQESFDDLHSLFKS